MKIAKILPIYKAGDKNVFRNYRPISLLSQFSKILEKVFSNRLTKFFNVNDIICKEQYGFRNSHSTELTILEMMKKLLMQWKTRNMHWEFLWILKKRTIL